MEDFYGEVIKKLKKLKAEKGITSEQLSKTSGVSLGTLNKLFAGSTGSIKLGTLSSLADALGVSLSDLTAGLGFASKNVGNAERKDISKDNFGYVRVGVATPEIKLADVEYNASAIISAAKAAAEKGVKVLALPELCLTGYTCGDLFYQQALLDAAERYVAEVAQNTKESGVLLFFGAPIRREGKIYNCAICCLFGKILAVIPKTFLPNYNEFYEKRHFFPAPKENSTVRICGEEYPFGTGYIFENALMPGMRVGVEICEDLWAAEPPSNRLTKSGANIIVNLSCSDETIGKAEYRRNLIKMQSAKTVSAYLYANAGEGESTTDAVYSGHSLICDNGKILAETELFKNSFVYSEIDTDLIEYERSKFYNYETTARAAERLKFDLPIERVA
ncbi:MAG: helix-turn-helix domain-containing protein, partial [Clostridia bacterium]|nr:helix-turn-helix domain-containing protein [Clostridia bacterium]